MKPQESSAHEQQMITRLKPFDFEMWKPYMGLELEGALAMINLIGDYWASIFPHFGIIMVNDDDQGLYETLYHNLFFIFGYRADLGVANAQIKSLIPDSIGLPSHKDGSAYDEEIQAAILDDIRSARLITHKLLIAEGRGFGPTAINTLVEPFVDEINVRKTSNQQSARHFAIRLGLIPAHSKQHSQPKSGRPTINLNYKDVSQSYWDLVEKMEANNERRKPSQKELCDYLASKGHRIGVTTLGKRIQSWKKKGLTWPPPTQEMVE